MRNIEQFSIRSRVARRRTVATPWRGVLVIVLVAVVSVACGKKPPGPPYKATGGGWIDIAGSATIAGGAAQIREAKAAPVMQPLPIASETLQDEIKVTQDGEQSIVNVVHRRGIGGAQIRARAAGWPAAVVVRLHGFPQLESLRAQSGDIILECLLVRPEREPAHQLCRLRDKQLDVLQHNPQYFEVTLPQALLSANRSPIDVRWVDQWR